MNALFKLFWAVAAICVLAGCSSTGRYNLNFHVSPECRDANGIYPSITIDVFGIPKKGDLRVSAISVNDYFLPGDSMREREGVYSFLFSDETPKKHTFSRGDKLWKTWKKQNATALCIVANIPGVWANKSGKDDPRRLILPITKDAWGWFQRTKYFMISPKGIKAADSLESLEPKKKKQ